MTFPIRFLLVCPAALLFASLAGAEAQAEVRGIVLDGRDGQAVPGAVVQIDEGKTETRSDAFGRFNVRSVGAGLHVLQVASPGYKKTRTEFRVEAGRTKEFQISLKPNLQEQSIGDRESTQHVLYHVERHVEGWR